ncbi:MAG: hypothetical protein HZB81_06280 [Deltaproteobacteria bacterium]|nr:hypothetical protein [Deltaproteobacteria bacterium]
MKSGSPYFHIKDELEAFKSKYYVKFRGQQNEITGIMLVPKLCLGTQLLLKLQLRKKDFEAGASGTSAFPSWSLGTRKRVLYDK